MFAEGYRGKKGTDEERNTKYVDTTKQLQKGKSD